MGIYFIWGVHNYGISGSTWGLGLTRTRTETTMVSMAKPFARCF